MKRKEMLIQKHYLMNKLRIISILLIAFSIHGCMVGPKFSDRNPELPEQFSEVVSTDSITNAAWWETFTNPVLDSVIANALSNNYEVMMAMSRLEQSALALGMAKADLLPTFDVQAGISRGDFTGSNQLASPVNNAFAAGLMNWELDLWGKYRHARNAANAQYLASDIARYATQLAVESQAASLYFQLLDYQERLEIARNTYTSRSASADIMRQRFERGVIAEIDYKQAVYQEAEAAVSIPLYEQMIKATQHALGLLSGTAQYEMEMLTGKLSEQLLPQALPDYLPADLLQRRPDIMQARQQLVAQYAAAGVAQSLRFPSLSLTMAGGVASNELKDLFDGNPAWSIGANLFGPVFQFGKLKRNAEIEKKKIEEFQAYYEQTVLQAFYEVKDALAELESFDKQLKYREIQLDAARTAAKLAHDRYDGGITSYLELLDAERALFSTELAFVQNKQSLLTAYVKLYKTLGGAW
jgi:multidrug efflux system outer membrane protein